MAFGFLVTWPTTRISSWRNFDTKLNSCNDKVGRERLTEESHNACHDLFSSRRVESGEGNHKEARTTFEIVLRTKSRLNLFGISRLNMVKGKCFLSLAWSRILETEREPYVHSCSIPQFTQGTSCNMLNLIPFQIFRKSITFLNKTELTLPCRRPHQRILKDISPRYLGMT